MTSKSSAKKNHGSSFKFNRQNIILAVVFLLALVLIGRLVFLQIIQHNFYLSKAKKQQEFSGILPARRGRIMLSDYSMGLSSSSPTILATDKNFATLYAIPKDLNEEQAKFLAEKLYNMFDSPSALTKQNLASSTIDKQIIINTYLEKLTKQDDPYEVLRRKLSEEELLGFYASILSSTSTPLSASDLEIKNSLIFNKSLTVTPRVVVTYPGLGYEMEPYRYYPEKNLGSQFLGFVNMERKGNYGLEEFYNKKLAGQDGQIKSERSGIANMLISSNSDYDEPKNGQDFILTIDRNVEFFACSKLKDYQAKFKFSSGTVIIVDPKTGAIIAMCSWPDFDPNQYAKIDNPKIFSNPAVNDQYEPGSVFKTITMAAALDQGKVSPETTYVDKGQRMIEGWPKPLSNSDFETFGGHGVTTMTTVLEKSLNTGAIFAMEQIGPVIFADYVKKFGFGKTAGIELPGEVSGDINSLLQKKIKPISGATASFGQGIAVTPLQMLMSYAALANRGNLMRPYIVKQIISEDGTSEEFKPKMVRQVVSEKTATTILAMLTEVVEKGHSKQAAVKGYYVGGKTGTAQIPAPGGGYIEGDTYIHTFVGMAPIDNPAFVMLVKLDRPQVRFAESSAAPLFGEIADFLLKYYKIPTNR